VRLLLVGAVLLGLSTIGDGFVYLLLQRREALATGWFPLLAVATSLVYLILAVPLGTLADRIGRPVIFLAGYAALLGVYLLLASPLGGWPLLVTSLCLYGAFYAGTDGVPMALAGPVLPAGLRTTGLALVQTGQALAYLVSSVLFGLAWQEWGVAGAIRSAAVCTGLSFLLTGALLVRGRLVPPSTADDQPSTVDLSAPSPVDVPAPSPVGSLALSPVDGPVPSSVDIAMMSHIDISRPSAVESEVAR
jgi:MFS family permease